MGGSILECMTQLHSSGAFDIKPNSRSYGSVINCWAKSGCKDAPDAAQKLLLTMKQQYLAGDKFSRPNKIIYSTVISAFAWAGQTEPKEEVLEEMYSDYLVGNDSCKPTVISFTTILDAWLKSKSCDVPHIGRKPFSSAWDNYTVLEPWTPSQI
jgi:hypothetical protein